MILQEGDYKIPQGYSIKRNGNTLIVYKSKRKVLQEGEYRCKDCVHYQKGYSLNSGWYETMICKMLLKRVAKDGRQVHKAVPKYNMPCDKFEPRKEDRSNDT